jgi:glycopeptide antibiotics resistance protein
MKKRNDKLLIWAVFIIYILVLFKLTVFRSGFFTAIGAERIINLKLFKCYIEALQDGRYLHFVYLFGGNIFFFSPFGFLLPYLTGRFQSIPRIALCGLLLSVIIEASQFIFAVGETEADDLLLNTLGVVIGFVVYRFYQKMIGAREKAKSTDQTEL